jgi:hypothetical protein
MKLDGRISKFMFEVCNYFQLTYDTCISAQRLLYKYMQAQTIITIKNLDISILACVFIQAKLNETKFPHPRYIIAESSFDHSVADLYEKELEILCSLNFAVYEFPISLQILEEAKKQDLTVCHVELKKNVEIVCKNMFDMNVQECRPFSILMRSF